MQILFVTTTPNRILEYLQGRKEVTLNVVDCSQIFSQKETKENVKRKLLSAIRTVIDTENVDMVLTYRCPCIIPQNIYGKARKGAFNIHPSLLPKYAGANPWIAIYNNKEKKSGVTLHVIDNGIDTGRIIFQREFDMRLDKDIKYHQDIVEKNACEMLNELFSYLNTR